MLNFSMIISGSAAVTYLLDTHGPNGLHCLTLSNFSKNMVLYGTTFFANGMVMNRGVKTSLLILGGCQAFCFIWSIPMYIFGKRARSYVSTNKSTIDTYLIYEGLIRLQEIRNYLLQRASNSSVQTE